MADNYSYPLDYSWSTEEIASVLTFLNQVEQAYEGGVQAESILKAYKDFKTVVPSKAEEKKLDKAFRGVSGYSTYQVIKKAREIGKGRLSFGS